MRVPYFEVGIFLFINLSNNLALAVHLLFAGKKLKWKLKI